MYENAANQIIPAVRSYIAKELVNTYKMSEENVAGMLDVAQAAVSKYINDKYSDSVKEVEALLNTELIDKYVEKIAQGNKKYVSACICTVCRLLNGCDCAFSKHEIAKL